MKKTFFFLPILFLFFASHPQQVTNLKGVTFGLGLGLSHISKTPKQSFLTTDGNYTLQQQNLGRSNITISSVITVKLAALALQPQQNQPGTVSEEVLVSKKRTKAIVAATPPSTLRAYMLPGAPPPAAPLVTYKKASFFERLTLNASLNLAEINTDNIEFNKSIDGGVGLGCYLNEFLQLVVLYDVISIRQLKDYFIENYLGKPIPSGSDVYNALDEKDNNLFYNKHFSGFSIKIVFSFGNK
jgi:hypothetical protein